MHSFPEHPSVSVILPTLNRASLLPRSVGSVLAQTFTDLELIVVDDGSTDDIAAAVASFSDPRIKVIRHESPRGPAAARNSGLTIAKGKYVAFQDSDDEWLPEKLEFQFRELEALSEKTALTICGLSRQRLDGSIWAFPLGRFPEAFISQPKSAVRYHPDAFALAFTQTWLVRRSALDTVGGFNESLRVWEDWDLLLRLSSRYDFVLNPNHYALSYATAGSSGANLPERLRSLAHLQGCYADCGDDRLIARLHYLSARYHLLAGRRATARPELIRALNLRPLTLRYWALAALMLAPASTLDRIFNPSRKSN